ncbi:MAG: FHA domain-containing protein [Deltaproteobacteria bacterium]|nr:FHA domain-containing protein [Deltaproteobacteria bacterium]
MRGGPGLARLGLEDSLVAPRAIVIGRSRDCDLVYGEATVSGHHARLVWRGRALWIEDLGSANGTLVHGKRIRRERIRPGDEVLLGQAPLPWSRPELRPFLRAGAGGDTVDALSIPGRRFICGSCGVRGVMPSGFAGGELSCGSCGEQLRVGPPRRRGRSGFALALLVLLVGGGVTLWATRGFERVRAVREAVRALGERAGEQVGTGAASPQEASIRAHSSDAVVAAWDSTTPLTRNTAVQFAAGDQGPYHVEQVARIWNEVRGRWHYVNDPRGQEYFARASESIANDYAGDCDDFAIVLAAMITAIGGESRVVMMDGPGGGHAYTEACIRDDPDAVRDRLATYYRDHRDDRLGRQRLREIHYRPSESCPVWLNLDWNAGVPGGDYEAEAWAVAIHADGSTETLAPAGLPPNMGHATGAIPESASPASP